MIHPKLSQLRSASARRTQSHAAPGRRHGWIIGVLTMMACAPTKIVEGYPDEFVGVGVELRITDEWPEVVRPLDGGPAAQAGLLPGDRILSVDGRSTAGNSLGDVVMRLRGEPNSQVSLGVLRKSLEITVVVQRRPMAKEGSDYRPKAERSP